MICPDCLSLSWGSQFYYPSWYSCGIVGDPKEHLRIEYLRVAEVSFRGGPCSPHVSGRGFRPGAPRDRRADPLPHRRSDLDGEAADDIVRDHRVVRNDHQDRTGDAAENDGWSSKAWRANSILNSTCGRRPSGRWRLDCRKSPAASKPSREPGRARTPTKIRLRSRAVQYHHIFGDCNFVNAHGNPMAPLAPVEEMLIEPNRLGRRRTKDRWTRQALPLQISASGAQPRRRGRG
jgi:hypothetical protein